MHERRIAEELVEVAASVVESAGATRAVACVVRGDSLAHLEEVAFTAWWRQAARGTAVEACELIIEHDERAPGFGVRLASVEVE